jgi:hypothetical protein
MPVIFRAVHLTLVRHVLIDFGVRIEPDLTDLRPDLTSKFSQPHSTMCRVHYPATADHHPGGQGLILYLKLSITGNELETIKRYRLVHPDFPHQTTLDQFFDEEQFEATDNWVFTSPRVYFRGRYCTIETSRLF